MGMLVFGTQYDMIIAFYQICISDKGQSVVKLVQLVLFKTVPIPSYTHL